MQEINSIHLRNNAIKTLEQKIIYFHDQVQIDDLRNFRDSTSLEIKL